MEMNTAGTNNVALGRAALESNRGGSESVAVGAYAMWRADHSTDVFATVNTAVGFEALMGAPQLDLNTGIRNTSVGHQSMLNNTSGGFNSAFGTEALMSNTTGTSLCALGRSALSANTTGSGNTGVGYLANVGLGTLSNATLLGRGATVNTNNKVRLGDVSVTVVEGQAPYSWPSDARFKCDVQEDVEGLDLILRLRPVSYSFDRAAFAKHIKEDVGNAEPLMIYALSARTVGFLAQEVEATVKELDYAAFDAVHVPDNPTDNYSVAYAQFVVPLVKAVLELAAENKLLKDELAATNNRVDELIAAQHEREITTMKDGELKVFPVPASDLVRIEVPSHVNGRSATLELLDARGSSMVQQAISLLGPAFDLILPSHSADGTYTVVRTGHAS